jgi:deoxyadenosine/deoxycytidine kinase
MHSITRPVIAIEGIIGSGKTTIAHQLGKDLNMRVLSEPVNNEMLEKFYAETSKYAFAMQMEMLARRYNLQQLAAHEALNTEYNGVILDRSLPGDTVFCEIHNECGNIPDLMYATYKTFRDIMTLSLQPPTYLLYLEVTAETAIERIKSRNRQQEDVNNEQGDRELKVDIHYLNLLIEKYNKLIHQLVYNQHPWSRGVQVITIDWNGRIFQYKDVLDIFKSKLAMR